MDDLRRPRLALGLLAAGALVLLATWLLAPIPEDFEQADRVAGTEGAAPDARRYAARGPAHVEYDEARDETLAVFRCAHGHCHHAVALRGDARDEVRRERVILVPEDGQPLAVEPLATPIRVDDGTTPWNNVTTRYAGAFHTAPAWPGLAGIDLGMGLLLASAAASLWRRPGWRAAALAAIAGFALGHWSASEGGEAPFVLALFLLFPAMLLGLGLLGLGGWWPRFRPWGAALVGGVLGALAAASLLRTYFPAPPTL